MCTFFEGDESEISDSDRLASLEELFFRFWFGMLKFQESS